MSSFSFLALPAELRVMIYRYLIPTHYYNIGPCYMNIRATCRAIHDESDHEATRTLRDVIREKNPGHALMLSAVSPHRMKMMVRRDTSLPLPDKSSMGVLLEDFPWLHKLNIEYEECGLPDVDSLVVRTVIRAIRNNVQNGLRPPRIGYKNAPPEYHMYLHVLFRWSGEEPAPRVLGFFDDYSDAMWRGHQLRITTTDHCDGKGRMHAYEWQGRTYHRKLYENVIAFLVFVSVFAIMLTLAYSVIIEFHALYCNLVVCKYR